MSHYCPMNPIVLALVPAMGMAVAMDVDVNVDVADAEAQIFVGPVPWWTVHSNSMPGAANKSTPHSPRGEVEDVGEMEIDQKLQAT
ncbi:GL11263 [Drosophila persimilis]|uniref:GL11263 n=1 Tax=Drosophila persimilis TaxID=7234 RepID=B4G9W0_DROPE|nr:GL11263 [Drosophila persimilis]